MAAPHRVRRKAESGLAGRVSLRFPLLTTSIAAWVIVALMPGLLGAPLGTMALSEPDLGIALAAIAATGVLWAGLWLVVAPAGRSRAG